MTDLSKYKNAIGIQASLLPQELTQVQQGIAEALSLLLGNPEYIAFCEHQQKVLEEVNVHAFSFVQEWFSLINSVGPLQMPPIDKINITDYKLFHQSLDGALDNQDISNLSKEEKKKSALQKDMYNTFKVQMLIFYYDYQIRGCNERNNYPFFKEQINQYDKIWGERNPRPIIMDKVQIKPQGLRDMVSYGYDKAFFGKYDQVYDIYEKGLAKKQSLLQSPSTPSHLSDLEHPSGHLVHDQT